MNVFFNNIGFFSLKYGHSAYVVGYVQSQYSPSNLIFCICFTAGPVFYLRQRVVTANTHLHYRQPCLQQMFFPDM